MEEKSVYIVVSQTGTILSRIIKGLTRKEYNHASLSLNEDLHIMYSFGRKYPYNPFYGSFVKESAEWGTFKRFDKTKIIVLKIPVEEYEYDGICEAIDYIADHPENYGYNYIGLFLAIFRIHFRTSKRYYCSEFVKDMLVKNNVEGASNLGKIPHPMCFLKMPNVERVYSGMLTDYITEAERVS